MVGRIRGRLNLLSPVKIETVTQPGYLHDGGGLYLQVSKGGGKSWIYRYTIGGRRREMGLGSFKKHPKDKVRVSLATARSLAAQHRSLVEQGKDPIAEREAEAARQRLEEARGLTFDQAIERFLESNEVAWRSTKHRRQWRDSLKAFASPVLGNLSVADIDTPDVTKVLDPIWNEMPATASRVRGRIERILDWARVRGYRQSTINAARWRGHLRETYPPISKVRTVQHHAAVAIDDAPGVYARLKQAEGMPALAFRFLVLTATRASEVMGARWPEIDLKARIWTIPASRMKAGKQHRVVLSEEAVAVLEEAAKYRADDWAFPGRRRGAPMALTTLTRALRAAGGESATVHGWRSTFKDWSSERTSFPGEMSEMALAHAIEDKVEAAYRRGELLQKRVAMMEQWATFVTTPKADGSNVVQMERRQG
jgi:integrase